MSLTAHPVRYLSAFDAAEIAGSLQKPRNQAVHNMILAVEKRIKHASMHGARDTVFFMPPYSTDSPYLDPDAIMPEVIKHFRAQCFYVRQLNAKSIYINWDLEQGKPVAKSTSVSAGRQSTAR